MKARFRILAGLMFPAIAWYAFVLLLPSIGTPSPSLPLVVRSGLMQHAFEVCEGRIAFADTERSAGLGWFRGATIAGNSYVVTIIPGGEGGQDAIVAYPRHHQMFLKPFAGRVLFLDSRRLTFGTFILRSDGSLWSNSRTGFDADAPPRADVVAQLGRDDRWSRGPTLPMTPPCADHGR